MTSKREQHQQAAEQKEKKQPQATGAPKPEESPKTDKSKQKITEISEEMAAELIRERDEYLESLQRLQAEFANYRKRVMRESEQLTQRASTEVIEDLLPVLDNFERAIKAATAHDEKVLGEGVELVYNQLRDILTKRGLCEIDAHGQPFDPTQHEAVLCRPSSEHEKGTVMEVLEKGYRVEDKVVRPAKVVVSDGVVVSDSSEKDSESS